MFPNVSITKLDGLEIQHDCDTFPNSAGAPILSALNLKLGGFSLQYAV